MEAMEDREIQFMVMVSMEDITVETAETAETAAVVLEPE